MQRLLAAMTRTTAARCGGLLFLVALAQGITWWMLVQQSVVICNAVAALGVPLPRPLIIVAAMILAIVVALIALRATDAWLAVGLMMAAAGGVSNLVDRFRFGCVVDYLNIPYLWTCNAADILIAVGAVLALTRVLRDGRHSQHPSSLPS